MTNFNHLILLIGTNPLPNFVVAEYFLKNNPDLKKIWLVYSEKTDVQEGTFTYAENLVNALEFKHSHKSISFNYIPLSDISSASKIFSELRKLLIPQLEDNSSVHLNYTGGTKVMGTHAYRSLSLEEGKRLSKTFSYLDARTFRIVADDKGYVTNDIRSEISLTFDELIRLHGFERKNKDSDFLYSIAMDKFRELIKNGKIKNFFHKNGGYDRAIFESKNKKGELAERLEDIDQDAISRFSPNNEFRQILSALPDEYNIFKEGIGKKFKNAIKFLDGDWFEEYVYETLKNNLTETKIEVLKNWEIKKDNWIGNFQLDVILMKGYQLVGISCTTSQDKSLCKSKGFEVIHRTRQIGGDEAKSVLFTLLDDGRKSNLQNELLIDTGSTTANILVFGIEDLNEGYIVKKIAEFIK